MVIASPIICTVRVSIGGIAHFLACRWRSMRSPPQSCRFECQVIQCQVASCSDRIFGYSRSWVYQNRHLLQKTTCLDGRNNIDEVRLPNLRIYRKTGLRRGRLRSTVKQCYQSYNTFKHPVHSQQLYALGSSSSNF